MPDPPYTRMIELVQLAQANGFEYGWTYDSHILCAGVVRPLPI